MTFTSSASAAEADTETTAGVADDSPFRAGRVEAETPSSVWEESPPVHPAAPYLAAPFVGALRRADDTEYTSDAAETLASEL